jgi:NAD(P)-dependent dehydrogenase (short-subunit alcohol dehydrogenase family)
VTALAERRVKALIHCAAIEGVHGLDATDHTTFDQLIAINFGGPFHLTQALAPLFATDSSIVFVSSVSPQSGRGDHAAYSASRAGLLGLAKSLAVGLAPRVRVNCVAPRAVQTPMFDQAITEFLVGLDDAQIQRALEACRILLKSRPTAQHRQGNCVLGPQRQLLHRHGAHVRWWLQRTEVSNAGPSNI